MRLVEILARELKEWPQEAAEIAQDAERSAHPYSTSAGKCLRGHWDGDAALAESYSVSMPYLASDHSTAIVTRADWEAERARIAKPAKKPNKDGWIRHRGGKCPVEAGALVEVKYRDGTIPAERLASDWVWRHTKEDDDIMRYRLHKPAEQPVIDLPQGYGEVITAKLDSIDGPYEWRDRITEINASVEALEEERASLLQRLEAEGFRLIERAVQPVEDMSDWRNWKVGDFLECVSIADKYRTRLTISKLYCYQGNGCVLDDDGDEQGYPVMYGKCFKFHSRPSK